MNIKKIIILGFAAVSTFCLSQNAEAQNLQSVSDFNKTHARLLASQSKVQDQIKLQEAEAYANTEWSQMPDSEKATIEFYDIMHGDYNDTEGFNLPFADSVKSYK